MTNTVKKLNPTTTSDVAEQIAILQDDIRSIAATVGELGKEKAAILKDEAKGRANAARDVASDQLDAAAEQAQKLQDQANTFVRDQPAAALGIAAGIGFLVGFMSSRK